MITYINGIATGKVVLVGIKGNGSGNGILDSTAYVALQTLGYGNGMTIANYDGFAMVG